MNSKNCASLSPSWQPTELVNTLLSRNARGAVRHWVTQKPFLDDHRHPRLLFAHSSGDAGFHRLIGEALPDVSPCDVYDELVRKGIAVQHEDGFLLLRRSAYGQDRGCVGL